MFNDRAICDRLRAYNIEDKLKDADGSTKTIGDCIDEIIDLLESVDPESPRDLF